MGLLGDGAGIGGRCRRTIGSLAPALVVILVTGAAGAKADVVIDSSVGDPIGLALHGSGDLFIANGDGNTVVEDTQNGSGFTRSRTIGGLNHPGAVAVDGSGTVFIADSLNWRVVKDTPTGSGRYTQSVINSNLNQPEGVAVDGSGDVFIADTFNNRVLEDKPNGFGGFTQSVIDSNLVEPDGVAVDGSGDVFIADYPINRVVEDTPTGFGGFTQSDVEGIDRPAAVAVDGFGDVFIAGPFTRVVLHPAPPRVVSAASLTGTPTYGLTLRLDFGFSTRFGPLGYVYQWERCSDQAMTQNCVTVGTNSRAYKLLRTDVGSYVTGTVTATNAVGQSTSSTSAADGPIAPGAPVLVNAAEITGPRQDGQYVRVGFKFSSRVKLTYSYQWQRCSDFGMVQSCVNIGGDHPYYKLTSADVRRYITATVTATNPEGQSTASTSQVVGPIAPPDPPTVLTPPSITGTQQAGHSLAASGYKFWGPDTLSYGYHWQRCADQAMSENCVTIGTGSHAYSLAKSDVGQYIAATVTATDSEGQSTSSTSHTVGPIG